MKIKHSLELKEVIHSKILPSFSHKYRGVKYVIVHTQILYFFPDMKKLNSHEYVDERPNIIAIVKLKNTDS